MKWQFFAFWREGWVVRDISSLLDILFIGMTPYLLFPFLEHFLKTTCNRKTSRECPGQGAGEPSMSLGWRDRVRCWGGHSSWGSQATPVFCWDTVSARGWGENWRPGGVLMGALPFQGASQQGTPCSWCPYVVNLENARNAPWRFARLRLRGGVVAVIPTQAAFHRWEFRQRPQSAAARTGKDHSWL